MSSIEAWLIIILVLGVIASNIAVLKYSAKFKMPQFGKPEDKPAKDSDSEEIEAEGAVEDKAASSSELPPLEVENSKSPTPSDSKDDEESKTSHLL